MAKGVRIQDAFFSFSSFVTRSASESIARCWEVYVELAPERFTIVTIRPSRECNHLGFDARHGFANSIQAALDETKTFIDLFKTLVEPLTELLDQVDNPFDISAFVAASIRPSSTQFQCNSTAKALTTRSEAR